MQGRITRCQEGWDTRSMWVFLGFVRFPWLRKWCGNLARDMSDSPTAPMTDAMADLMKPTVQVPEMKAEVEEKTPESPKTPKRESPIAQEDEKSPVTTPAKKQKKKCGVCKKKLGLTGRNHFESLWIILNHFEFTRILGFECRCGLYYCGIHRYSDQHNCPFDYKVTLTLMRPVFNPDPFRPMAENKSQLLIRPFVARKSRNCKNIYPFFFFTIIPFFLT